MAKSGYRYTKPFPRSLHEIVCSAPGLCSARFKIRQKLHSLAQKHEALTTSHVYLIDRLKKIVVSIGLYIIIVSSSSLSKDRMRLFDGKSYLMCYVLQCGYSLPFSILYSVSSLSSDLTFKCRHFQWVHSISLNPFVHCKLPTITIKKHSATTTLAAPYLYA